MQEKSEQFAIGRLVPGTKYRTRALIGSGGMGSVYEVEHIELGKLFVLKALRAQLVERTDLAARMKNEWRALGRLQHPNIVTVTDAGTTEDGVPFFVMERLEGETLATRLRREKRLSVPLALRIAAGILKALAAAHAIDVVHRDIKPQNVFLPAPGGVKLLDFGVAKLHDRDREAHVVTARGVAIGTPKYMSPEQAEGKVIDGRADIYAVGLVIFEMIAGRGPFAHRRDANELVLAHMSEAPTRLDSESEAPPEVADLVQRWLSKSPADRPVDAAHAVIELKHLLERYTFDGASEGSTSAATANADYAAATHAEPAAAAAASEQRPPSGPNQRTLALGTSSRVSSTQVGSAEGAPEKAPVSARSESPSTQLLTGTMSAGDAPATRTVLPAPASKPPASKQPASDGARPGAAAKAQRPTPRTGTPPPVERSRALPELSLPRLLAVAAGAAALSFCVAALLRGPTGGAEERPKPVVRSTVAAAQPELPNPGSPTSEPIAPASGSSVAATPQGTAPSGSARALPAAEVPAEQPSASLPAATPLTPGSPAAASAVEDQTPRPAAPSKAISARPSSAARPTARPSSGRMPDSGL
jgi:serine/threonine-protein kinase